MKAMVSLAVALLITASPAIAQRCKYEVETESQVESKMLTLFRGGVVGLAGYFGVSDNEPYLRARYFSQFKAKAEFTPATPLELTLDDGSVVRLEVIVEDGARLKVWGAAFNNREAQPTYKVTTDQLRTLARNKVVRLKLNFVVDGEPQSTEREVKESHADSIVAAINCLPGIS